MKTFNDKLQAQFALMCATGKLFRVNISGQAIYDLYLRGFEMGMNPVFRDPNSSVHNCNNCHNFIRRYGNIVAVDPETTEIITIFGAEGIDDEYRRTAELLDLTIKQNGIIENVFFETFNELKSLPYEACSVDQAEFQLGTARNVKRYTKEEAEMYGVVKPNEIRTFEHMNLKLPTQFVWKNGDSIDKVMADYRDKFNVFKRGLEDINVDTLQLVADLAKQGSLLDGMAHYHMIQKHIGFKEDYMAMQGKLLHNWLWETSYVLTGAEAKFRNSLIGTLCLELTQGEDINHACKEWNKRVDPANYMKVKSPITQKQIDEAQKFVEENGYTGSFDRRLADVDDINVNEIKHISTSTRKVKAVTIFDNVKPKVSTQHKRAQFNGVEEVSIDKFMEDILPTSTGIEVLLENNHEGNLVTLTTAEDPNSKPIFKWDNNFSWTFKGNLAGKSQIKEAVQLKGGKVDGVLRFSMMWAENDPSDNSDLDAWCSQPNGLNIGFTNKRDHNTGGVLDIDIMAPRDYRNTNIVENITWPELNRMPYGVYLFWVNQYEDRGSKGFRAEIEFNGELYSYEYNQPVKSTVQVAKVTLSQGVFSIEHILPSTSAAKELWGLKTQEFHKVNLVCLSPNHWGNNKVGNLHYMFMLDGCKISEPVRSFHNENLIPELLTHRKVMDILGSANMIEGSSHQLSGVGFNATVKDELIVRVSGSHKRVIKIKF